MTTLKNGIVIDEKTYNSPNYWPGRPNGVKSITIHWWGLPAWKQKFDQVATFLSTSRGASSTSAHYVISDTRVACLVSPGNRAWHALAGNETSVGLELDPNGGEKTLENAAQVIAMLEDYYNTDFIIYPHHHWTPTMCPGHFAGKIQWIADRVNQIRAGKTPTIAVETPVPTVLQSQPPRPIAQPGRNVQKGDTLSKIARYFKGKATRDVLEAIAAENGITVNTPLRVGQRIKIPAPLVWIVEAGDTWESIAAYYDFDVAYLKSLNPGVSLVPGNVLRIW